MRVLFWTELFWPYIGGVEVLGRSFVDGMRRRGYEFAVVTGHGSLDLPDEDEHEGVPIHRLPFYAALQGRDIELIVDVRRRLIELKEAFAPDLVHLSFTDPCVLFHFQTDRPRRTPLLVAVCLSLPRRLVGADTLVGRTLGAADWVTATTQAVLREARAIAPEIAGRSSVVYNGVREPALEPEPLPADPPRVLCLGRVVEEKGFDVAVAAFPRVLADHPGASLVIAGDGPARPGLEEQARELGLADAVRFAGWVEPEEVPALINTASAVLVPSRWQEAFGLVAVEAALMARPVVATAVGGLPEVVVDGETGLIVPAEDAEALAEAFESLLTDPERAVQMGEAARRRARDVFSWSRYLDEHERLYHRIVKEAAHAGSP